MIDEHDVREMLQRRANAVSTTEVDAPAAVRRGRRRLLATGTAAVLAAAAIAVGTFAGVAAIRNAPIPAVEDRSEELGIFAPVAGRILYVNDGTDSGYGPGVWAVDPNGPADTQDGEGVADDVVSTLVPLELEATPIGWSSDGTELLLMRTDGDQPFPEQFLSVLNADGTETPLNDEPMYFAGAAISPDGSRVVFGLQGVETERLGLYIVDADGGRPIHLPLPAVEGIVADPTFSPDGTQIAYVDSGESENHVWVIGADGSDPHEILANEGALIGGAGSLQWSPAGDRIALGVGDHEGGGRPSIYTFAPDGSDFTKVVTGGIDPHWSPDGSRIAFTIPCDAQPDDWCPEGSIRRDEYDPQPGEPPAGLAVADADGSNVRELGFAASGPWHPGASEIDVPTPPPTETDDEGVLRANGEVLSVTHAGSGTLDDLVAVDPETGADRVLVEDLDLYAARWSADGRWVAYETRGPQGSGVWVMGASLDPRLVASGASMLGWSSTGAELATIRLTAPLGVDPIDGSTVSTIDPASGATTDVGTIPDDVGEVTSVPAWSPDGARFVFGARGGALYAVDALGGASSLLAQLPGEDLDSVDHIVWSPDGTHIAVVIDGRPGGVYVMDADGSNVRLLPGDWADTTVAWSPDGTRLAYQGGSGAIWVAPTDGSAPTEIGKPLRDSCFLICQDDLTWSPEGILVAFRTIAVTHDGSGLVEASAIDADGLGEPEHIDAITFASWAGGSYDCGCA